MSLIGLSGGRRPRGSHGGWAATSEPGGCLLGDGGLTCGTAPPAIINSLDPPHVKLSGDIEGSYAVEGTRKDGRLVISPDTSSQAIMERLGHEPATLAEFEAEFGAAKPPTARVGPVPLKRGFAPGV